MTEAPDTRLRALEAELAAARAELQEFTYAVSHDLRAPLRHIVSFADLVREDAGPLLNAEVLGFLDTITDSARHMTLLLDGLLALSRVGSVALHLAHVPLQPLVQEVCGEVALQFPGRCVEWNIAPQLPVVWADPALLRQALAQVLGNAVKFTAPRAVANVSITEHPCATDQLAQIEIRDNGVGFNPALAGKLFQVFGRLHAARDFAGIGVGLALTRKSLERMGGRVHAQGAPDTGCGVFLQLLRAADEEAPSARAASEGCKSAQDTTSKP